jgi:hypothetical protein
MAAAGANENSNAELEATVDLEGIGESFMSGKKSCIPFIDVDGKVYYVKVAAPEARSRNFDAFREAVQAMTEAYRGGAFAAAPDGIYTWILGDKGFAAAKVRSRLELGTLHKQLAFLTGTKSVRAAGECKKEGVNLEFNIESGTYSLPMSRSKKSGTATLLKRGEKAFRGMGLEAKGSSELRSLITDLLVPITRAELQRYKDAGFEVLMTVSEKDCSPVALAGLQGRLRNTRKRIELYNAGAEKIAKKYAGLMEEYEALRARGDPKAEKTLRAAGYFKPRAGEREGYVRDAEQLEGEIEALRAKYILFGGGRGRGRGRTRRSGRR